MQSAKENFGSPFSSHVRTLQNRSKNSEDRKTVSTFNVNGSCWYRMRAAYHDILHKIPNSARILNRERNEDHQIRCSREVPGKRGYAGNDELLAGMARSMSGSKYFSGTASLKEFIISQGDFIYKQLIGLDTMLKANDKGFEDIPALTALRDESKKQAHFANAQARPSNATLRMLHLRLH
ncbi:hypothetical protein KIW84_057634 [Lathyrus oleraceus]|uniref:Uncharacterized protein n=1 Tax=Pisum sativum TaxID=3888 RepID=A0A9D4X6F8_PEA|nr:hypothetical protein KIW84_057634 [Pisum sativum]